MTTHPRPPSTIDLERALDVAMRPPQLSSGDAAADLVVDYGMTLGIDVTRAGRLWSAAIAGGDNHRSFVVLRHSDDGGDTWSAPDLTVNAGHADDPLRRRSLVATVWVDPDNRLWLFVDQAITYFDGRAGVWASVCEAPDGDPAAARWSEPVRIGDGAVLNKPIVLRDGTWVMAGSLWDRAKIHVPGGHGRFPWPLNPYRDHFRELDAERGTFVLESSDDGRSWRRTAVLTFSPPEFDEPRVLELRDGTLWLTARLAEGGPAEARRAAGSDAWATPRPSPTFRQPSSRHALQRLRSGALLLVKNGASLDAEAPGNGRTDLTAYLSDDDGMTWSNGLVLDDRTSVSYPDVAQLPDGRICVQYDHQRNQLGEIVLARLQETDLRGDTSGLERVVVSRSDPEAAARRLELDQHHPPQ